MATTPNRSKSVRVLDLLALAGSKGMRFSEIQQALWEMTYEPEDRPWVARSSSCRGYWCTNLCGGPFYHRGLLNFFATRGADGRWRRNKVAHNGRPWKTMNDEARKRRGTPYNFPWG